MKPKTLSEVALQMLIESQSPFLWYGNPNILHEIYEEWRRSHGRDYGDIHPTTCISVVLSAVSRSRLFKKAGAINHLGRWYPCFEPLESKTGTTQQQIARQLLQGKKENPLKDVIGQWPGDETDQEFDQMIKDLLS